MHDRDGSIRNRGGNVPIVIDTLVFDEAQITSPTNGNHPQWGGCCHSLSRECGRAVVIISYQNVTGTLNPGAHPGSYNGQDAYNDMLVTDYERTNSNGHGTGQCRNHAGGVSNIECKP